MVRKETKEIEAAQTRQEGHKRLLNGVVVSNRMRKTIVVKVDRRVKHGEYAKYVLLSKRYKAHDEKGEARTGDRVEIIESRPLGRDKRWALRRIVARSTLQQGEVV